MEQITGQNDIIRAGQTDVTSIHLALTKSPVSEVIMAKANLTPPFSFIPTKSHRAIDVTGQQFGYLTVIGHVGDGFYICQCECGVYRRVEGQSLRGGRTRSCGRCAHQPIADRSLYNIWSGMKDRCLNPRNHAFASYGGRGITLCDAWRSYEQFLLEMSPRPSLKHSIDRIDNDGPYAPDNCRWATQIEQTNNRSNNHQIALGDGKSITLTELARQHGLNPATLFTRAGKGWCAECLVRPLEQGRKHTCTHGGAA